MNSPPCSPTACINPSFLVSWTIQTTPAESPGGKEYLFPFICAAVYNTMPRLTHLNGLYNISSIKKVPLIALILYLILLSVCCWGILFISGIQLNCGKGTCILVKKWKDKLTVHHEQQIGSVRQEARRGREKTAGVICVMLCNTGFIAIPVYFLHLGEKNESGVSEEPGRLLLHTGKC